MEVPFLLFHEDIVHSIKWNELYLLSLKFPVMELPHWDFQVTNGCIKPSDRNGLSWKHSGIISKNETHLEFVGRVERNFSHFLVLLSNIHDITQNDFCEFQQSCFRGITYHDSLYTRKRKQFLAHVLLHFHQKSMRDSTTHCMLKQQCIYVAIFKLSWKIITVKIWDIYFALAARTKLQQRGEISFWFCDSAGFAITFRFVWKLCNAVPGQQHACMGELTDAQSWVTLRKALME